MSMTRHNSKNKIKDITALDFYNKFQSSILENPDLLSWSNIYYCHQLYLKFDPSKETDVNSKNLIDLFNEISLIDKFKQIPHDKLNVNMSNCAWSNAALTSWSDNGDFTFHDDIIKKYNTNLFIK